jgi:hypothetical protein
MIDFRWFTVTGLCLDIAGAFVLAWGLVISKEEAIRLGVTRYSGDTDEENLTLPTVRDRRRQSHNTRN